MLKHWVLHYLVAAGAVAAAFVVRSLLDPFFPAGVPFITFFLAVMVAAWYGGVGPALVAAGLSTLLADYFFIDPVGMFKLTPAYAVVLAVFSLEALGIAFLSGGMQEAKSKAIAERSQREQLLNSISDGFVALDDEWRYTAVNARAADILGKTTGHLLGRIMWDVFPGMIGTRFWTESHEVRRSRRRAALEFFSEARRRWYETRLYPAEQGLAMFFTDITEQKQAQEALRESEDRFRVMADTAPVLIWVSDTTSLCTWVNQPWLDFTGRTLAQEIGQGWAARVHPEDVDRCMSVYTTSFDQRRPFTREYRLRRHDDQYRWLLDHGIPRYADSGDFVGYIGSCVDVTERRQVEDALRESEQRLTGLVTTAMDAIISVDEHQRITLFNRAAEQMFGCPAAEAIGQPLDRFIPERYRQAHRDHVADFGRTGMTTRRMGKFGTIYGLRANGEEFPLEASISHLDVRGRKLFTVILRDISRRLQAEQELRDSEERLRALAGQLEHLVEERTQELVQSQGRLRALATELNLTEQRERQRLAVDLHDHLAQMLVLGKLKLAQGKRLAFPLPACAETMKQVDDVLSDALRYTRTLVAELSPPVLREHGLPAGLKWLREYMARHDLDVTVTVPERETLQLPEDQVVLLFQSVRELLINSWKYAGTGKAEVILELRDDEVRIHVQDTGRGFDPAAATAAVPVEGASGGLSSKFGLFSIQERMKALGGRFHLRSAPGKGTTATLTLPLRGSVRDERDARDKRDEKDSLAKPGRPVSQVSPFSPVALAARIRVLLVDDHTMVRQGLRSVLDSYHDVEVVGEARNGEEAVAEADRLRPHVVVMDINMPKMNGIEATARIKAAYPRTAVIGLSVNAGGENQEAMSRAGAHVLLTKEAAVDRLYGAIQEAVGHSPLQKLP